MRLDYLDFDYSEDEEGTGTWDAMACVTAERVPALATEIEQVLRWASRQFNGRQGSIDAGGDWDYDLQAQDDAGRALSASFDAASSRLHLTAASAGRSTVSLSLSGSMQFGDALREQFELDAE